MGLSTADLPALYRSADKLSAISQRTYLHLIASEYAVLITCALMTVSPVAEWWYFTLYTLLFGIGLSAFVYRFLNKPEQAWYQGRALAESIKTLSWKFMMRAEPFDHDKAHEATKEFTGRVLEVLRSNRFAGKSLPDEWANGVQVSERMLGIRHMSLPERCRIYEKERIGDQRTWYARKSRLNRQAGKRWAVACIVVYAGAILSSLTRIAHPEWIILPTEPLIALAASIVGWIQVKKFNELASSYILTAHEIGLLHNTLDSSSETEFSEFVSNAEQAFSREHTQWVARFGE